MENTTIKSSIITVITSNIFKKRCNSPLRRDACALPPTVTWERRCASGHRARTAECVCKLFSRCSVRSHPPTVRHSVTAGRGGVSRSLLSPWWPKKMSRLAAFRYATCSLLASRVRKFSHFTEVFNHSRHVLYALAAAPAAQINRITAVVCTQWAQFTVTSTFLGKKTQS